MSPSNHSQDSPTTRRTCHSNNNKSVKFSPQVSLRIVSSPSSSSSPSSFGDDANNNIICNNNNNYTNDYSAWHSIHEIKSMKFRAKSLAKLYYHLHINNDNNINNIATNNNNNNNSKAADRQHNRHPSTYELDGESLRGMEYLTDLNSGRFRQSIKFRAIALVAMKFHEQHQLQLQNHEQQNDRDDHELDQDFDNDDQDFDNDDQDDDYDLRNTNDASFMNNETSVEVIENTQITTTRMTASSMAQEYSKKCLPALKYSQCIAEVDAREAAAILKQDLTTSNTNTMLCCANQSFNALNDSTISSSSVKPSSPSSPIMPSCCPSPQSVLELGKSTEMMLKTKYQQLLQLQLQLQLLQKLLLQQQHQQRVALPFHPGNHSNATNGSSTTASITGAPTPTGGKVAAIHAARAC